jgi:hypothetical protein
MFPTTKFIIPTLTEEQSSLRIKLLSTEEWETLAPPSDGRDRFEHSGFLYQFSTEPYDLLDTPGVLVSVWQKADPAALKCEVTYDYCMSLYEVYKDGFGARCTADCGGVNAYRAPTNSNRAHPSPGFGQEQIAKQQYYRRTQSFPLIQALIEKRLHDHTNFIVQSALQSNPTLFNLVGHYCKKAIITCGLPPIARKETKHYTGSTTKTTKPTLGFHNDLHIDMCDMLTKEYQEIFKAQCYNDPTLCRLFKRYKLGLPTTCGYQFLFNRRNSSINPENLQPIQYFACDGLGLALPISHGMTHHFMGWIFSHRTTACIVYDNMNEKVFINNLHDFFMVYAWGKSGGTKEVKAYTESHPEEDQQD